MKIRFFKKYEKQINKINDLILRGSMLIAFLLCAIRGYADDDIFAPGEAQVDATVKGSGLHYIYVAEVVLGFIYYIKSRNPLAFVGIGILVIMTKIGFSIAGLS